MSAAAGGGSVAFYAPMKAPGHAAPSGDRLMARQLMAALAASGHDVALASDLRTYLRDPEDTDTYRDLLAQAERERDRIDRVWRQDGPPGLWVSYHPYHKSPDLLGPDLCKAHGVPLVTFEASHSYRRSQGHWSAFRDRALEAVQMAAINIAFTARDAAGLRKADPDIRLERVAPFIDCAPYLAMRTVPDAEELVAVAMMRPGDKLTSFGMLAQALERLGDRPWHLTAVGDGPARAEVEALFAALPRDRIAWAGERDPQGVRTALAQASVFVWPGCGEAFGLAYLEAQAMGLPVVALETAGVPEVVQDGVTGLLTPAGDVAAFADAVGALLGDSGLRARLGANARRRVQEVHSLEVAAGRIAEILDRHVWSVAGDGA